MRRFSVLRRAVLLAAVAASVAAGLAADTTAEAHRASSVPVMRAYETRYYIIHSDLDDQAIQEAAARLTAMAEEYHERTNGFSGQIRSRLPFYLFGTRAGYAAAGGRPGSAGQYNGRTLKALADKDNPDHVWRVVQHEAFHQFAREVIGGRLATWVNEGLAEYFGGGLWTGDHFLTGLVPPDRLARVKAMIAQDRLLPMGQMLSLTDRQWLAAMSGRNYDQAWSMVHFLVHAEAGRYRAGFEQFIKDASRGKSAPRAFAARVTTDLGQFQDAYRRWWLSQGDDPTADRYALAAIQTLTSFLARADSRGQRFADAEGFFQAGRAGQLQAAAGQRLPQRLLAGALDKAPTLGQWSLQGSDGPRLALTTPTGELVGSFAADDGLVTAVQVDVRPGPIKPAASGPAGLRPSEQSP